MPKRYFDAIVIVPLEEEFETALSHFNFVEDLSTTRQIRFAVAAPGSDLTILLVKQNAMGKTENQNAAHVALGDFDAGSLICLGIAGGLSHDVNIGDVCYTGTIFDLHDNNKVTDTDLAFSPKAYDSPLELDIAINLDRVNPETKRGHEQWCEKQEQAAKAAIPGKFLGKRKELEEIQRPKVKDGAIACGFVSDSPEYNKRVKDVDRRMLAIETESGGLFSVAKIKGIPALTVRGISDYAGYGLDKNLFEEQTNHKARFVAASNAASFLARQLARNQVKAYLVSRRAGLATKSLAAAESIADRLARALLEENEKFDAKLRDLAPAYSLQAKGYRLPVPRIRIVNTRLGTPDADSQPIELRDGLRANRVLILQLPPQYPDLSLSWIIARDLLLAQFADKQALPTVIEATHLRPPDYGLQRNVSTGVLAFENTAEAQLVIIVDSFNFDSRTRTSFMLKEVERFPHAKFVIVTRNKFNIVAESQFAASTAAAVASICDVSFLEISHFLQRNFEMASAAAEVVAARLRETFLNFKLPVHPSYFAGIPGATLAALLSANKRAELIELAVAGYLSYVVAQDDEPVALGRKTREIFLRKLAFQINVEKREYTEAQLVAVAEELAKKYDFKISPTRFVEAFISKGILHIESDRIRFTLPFMESYLLAKELYEMPDVAEKYFEIGDSLFNFPAFTIFAELGVPNSYVKRLLVALDTSVAKFRERATSPLGLATDSIAPKVLQHRERIASLHGKVQQTVDEIVRNDDKSQEKQRLLDAADRVREAAAHMHEQQAARNGVEAKRTIEGDALSAWVIGVGLLGSGAERLEADTKRVLINKIVVLTALIADDWTRHQAKIDFEKLKKDLLTNQELLDALSKSKSDEDIAEARRMIDGLVSVLEYGLILQPFSNMMAFICEEARDKVLAESIKNTSVEGEVEELVRSAWLSDIDTIQGAKDVRKALTNLPKAKLLRVMLAGHLIMRVYWKHWDKESRLRLLALAAQCLKALGKDFNTGDLQRLIKFETEADE